MGLFSYFFGPKKLKGKITCSVSGISITLPKDYGAYQVGDKIYLIGADKEYGIMMFSTENIIMLENHSFINPFTQQEETPEITQEGIYETYTIKGIKDTEWSRVWTTFSKKFRICFFYTCRHTDKEIEIPRMMEIMDTLQIPADI